MNEVFIVSAVRTPIGAYGGSLKDLSATQLGSIAIREAVSRSGIDPTVVNDVLMGCVVQANLGQAPARQASKFAGLPDFVNSTTINKVCASGMKAIAIGAQGIRLGDTGIVVAGGMESMSNIPFYLPQMRWGNKFGNGECIDGLAKDGLTDVYDGKAMGFAAELCARECGISREEQDEFAVQSYQRSQQAWQDGSFADEVMEVEIPGRKGESVRVSRDEEPFNVKFEKISTLKPAFLKDGTVTAANASTLNDGAAAVVLMGAEQVAAYGLKPMAKIISWADAEQAPEWFTTTPAIALPRALDKAGLKAEDISYWELNEAFAVVGIENSRRLKLNSANVNIHGGAVSLGHPLGCSGARIIVTLLNVLKTKGGRYGAAGICNGGGGASAMVIENLT